MTEADVEIIPEFNRPHPTQHEIAVAAYYLWLKEGCPWGNAEITFANWIDSEGNLENKPSPPTPLPIE